MNAKVESRRESLRGRLAAEFVVVVLGVVVGLGVDQWRQSLSDAVEETSYYERLAHDIDGDVRLWEELLRRMDPKDEALSRIQAWVASPTMSDEAVLRRLAQDLAFAAMYSGSVPQPRRSAYTELLSTGRLGLLRDAAFRTELLEYYHVMETLLIRLSSRTTGYESMAYALVPREAVGGSDASARTDLSASDLRSIAERTLTQDLIPVLVAERNRTVFLRIQFEQRLAAARRLLAYAEAQGAESSA